MGEFLKKMWRIRADQAAVLSLIVILFGLHVAMPFAEAANPKKKTPPTKKSTPVAAENAPAQDKKIGGLLTGDEKESGPILVKSDNLKLDAKSRVFTYQGNVQATRDDLTITSERMIGEYDDKNQLKTLRAEKNVVITRGEILRATSDKAFYDVPKNKIELTQKPELINKGNALTADKITLFINEDRSDAEGDVRVRILKADDLNSVTSAAGSVPALAEQPQSAVPATESDNLKKGAT